MARPKRGEGVPAQERLEGAFWQILAEQPYQEMTIAALSRRAQVNHNTFYYYFDSLDDMAIKMLHKNLVPELPGIVIKAFTANTMSFEQLIGSGDIWQRMQRLCLMAGGHSTSWLIDELKSSIMDIWIMSLGIDKKTLEERDKIVLTFALSGILAVVGTYGLDGDPSVFTSIVEGDLGKGILKSLTQIAAGATTRT